MNILDISIVFFLIMEVTNVLILYFVPHTKVGNGVGVFNSLEQSKQDEDMHYFVKYLINWVAGAKFIFIVLLLVILLMGDDSIKVMGVVAMLISISSYFFRLSPIIKKLDKRGMITPKGYSKALDGMIIGFLIIFAGALALYFI